MFLAYTFAGCPNDGLHGLGVCVHIHFPEGACAGLPDGTYLYVPSFYIAKKDIVGSNGAGDAFCAGVLFGLHENWELKKCLSLGGAFSNFNLHSATASGGAVDLDSMLKFMEDAKLSPMPDNIG